MSDEQTEPAQIDPEPEQGQSVDDLPEDEWRPVTKARSIVVRIDGATHVLRAPKIGERKRIVELLSEIGASGDRRRDEARQQIRADQPDANERTVAALAAGQVDQTDDVLGWWEEVFSMLDVSGNPLPARDALPTWLLDERLMSEAQQHWRTAPRTPGS